MFELLQPRLPSVKLPIGPNFLKRYQYEVRVIIQRDLFLDFPIEKAAQAPGRMCVSICASGAAEHCQLFKYPFKE